MSKDPTAGKTSTFNSPPSSDWQQTELLNQFEDFVIIRSPQNPESASPPCAILIFGFDADTQWIDEVCSTLLLNHFLMKDSVTSACKIYEKKASLFSNQHADFLGLVQSGNDQIYDRFKSKEFLMVRIVEHIEVCKHIIGLHIFNVCMHDTVIFG